MIGTLTLTAEEILGCDVLFVETNVQFHMTPRPSPVSFLDPLELLFFSVASLTRLLDWMLPPLLLPANHHMTDNTPLGLDLATFCSLVNKFMPTGVT